MTNDSSVVLNEFWEKLGIPCVTLNQASDAIHWHLKCGVVPCLIGEGGIGKTDIYRQIAEDLEWEIHFMFLAHLEREDLVGIPYPQNGDGVYKFLIEDNLRKIIVDSTRDVLLVLDEWNRGEKEVMGASFTMMEHRRYGSVSLPPHVHIAAAMNPSEGSYLVNECEKDPAFRRRLGFIGVRADAIAFIAYAKGRGDFHPLVVHYAESNPSAIIDIQARDSGKVYCNPAALEKVSNILYKMDSEKFDYRANLNLFRTIIAGIVGVGTAAEFCTWLANENTLINPNEVMRHYDRAQRSILKLVEDGLTPQVHTLCQSVANLCVTQELLDDTSIENLGKLYRDLKHNDYLHSLTEAIHKAGETLGKREYFSRLNVKLGSNEYYLAAHSQYLEARRNVQQQIEER